MQWRRGADKGTVRRFTWVCGQELVLVQEVKTTILGKLMPLDAVSFTASLATETDIWMAAGALPSAANYHRLVVVYDAQNLKRWQNLITLVEHSRELSHLYMVFVSSEPGLTQVPGAEEDSKPVLAPHLAALRDAAQGQLVVCSTPSYEDLIAWTKRQAPLSDNLAAYLLTRCGGELSAARDTCIKIRTMEFPEISRSTIDELAVFEPAVTFSDALITGDKRTAMAALPDPYELGSVIGLLDSRLDMLAELHQAAADGMSAADMHSRLHAPQFVIAKYRRYAGSYTETSVRHRRAILAVADAAFRQGARTGVAESIVALW